MLKLTLVEFLLRLIPEGFLFIFAGYAFSRTKIEFKRYIISSVILSILGFLTRLLPINFGIHSVLILIACIILLINVNKILTLRAVTASLVIMLIGFAAEAANGFFIQFILKKDINIIFNDPIQKVLYGLPSLAFMWIIVVVVYIILYKKDKLKDANYRKISE